METHGEGNWAKVSKLLGLKRGGKSCRLRWKNYLRPNIKRGAMSKEEEDLIIRMHNLLGNRLVFFLNVVSNLKFNHYTLFLR